MLELRPNCELCDRDLPASSKDARICTYECTYCAECVDTILHNVCPTCGGGFAARPIRPKISHREEAGLGLKHHPAGTRREHSKYSRAEIERFVGALRNIDPAER